MQLEKGSGTVPVALFGVSPNSWRSRSHSLLGALGRVLPARRRDAEGNSRDDRAPHQSTASVVHHLAFLRQPSSATAPGVAALAGLSGGFVVVSFGLPRMPQTRR